MFCSTMKMGGEECVVSAMPRPLYPQEKAPVPTVQEAEWDPGPVQTGVEKRNYLAPTWVQKPKLPPRSESQ
jgi:hypothetical protein